MGSNGEKLLKNKHILIGTIYKMSVQHCIDIFFVQNCQFLSYGTFSEKTMDSIKNRIFNL